MTVPRKVRYLRHALSLLFAENCKCSTFNGILKPHSKPFSEPAKMIPQENQRAGRGNAFSVPWERKTALYSGFEINRTMVQLELLTGDGGDCPAPLDRRDEDG
jgi:hypothetical protein